MPLPEVLGEEEALAEEALEAVVLAEEALEVMAVAVALGEEASGVEA